MSKSDSVTFSKKKNKKRHPAVGMWKDKWPDKRSSSDIARELRKDQWQRS